MNSLLGMNEADAVQPHLPLSPPPPVLCRAQQETSGHMTGADFDVETLKTLYQLLKFDTYFDKLSYFIHSFS